MNRAFSISVPASLSDDAERALICDAPEKPDWMVHGGRIDAALRTWPDAPTPWIDLSTGLNPKPYPMPPMDAVDWAALPDRGALATLEDIAARAFGAQRAGGNRTICAVPGSEVGIRLLGHMDLPRPVRIASPSYGSYAEAWPDAEPVESGAPDPEQGTLILANPNNPDGRCRSPGELLEIADRLAARGGVLIVDEAFADAVPELSLCPYIADRPNVVVLRSFGKFFGLGGVRLGFVLASDAICAGIRRRLGDWPVSAAALAVGTRAYSDAGWADRAIATITAAAERLDDLFAARGFASGGGCPLFRVVETQHAARLFEGLARAGIWTRPFAYRADWLRIGLPGDAAGWGRLESALDDLGDLA